MRRVRRFLLGCVATAVVCVVTFGVWWTGIDRFDEDYCTTAVVVPDGETRIDGPEWELPMTYRCDYGAAGEVTVNEPKPILWTGVMGGITLLLVSAVWWWLARHPSARAEYEGKHRT